MQHSDGAQRIEFSIGCTVATFVYGGTSLGIRLENAVLPRLVLETCLPCASRAS